MSFLKSEQILLENNLIRSWIIEFEYYSLFHKFEKFKFSSEKQTTMTWQLEYIQNLMQSIINEDKCSLIKFPNEDIYCLAIEFLSFFLIAGNLPSQNEDITNIEKGIETFNKMCLLNHKEIESELSLILDEMIYLAIIVPLKKNRKHLATNVFCRCCLKFNIKIQFKDYLINILNFEEISQCLDVNFEYLSKLLRKHIFKQEQKPLLWYLADSLKKKQLIKCSNFDHQLLIHSWFAEYFAVEVWELFKDSYQSMTSNTNIKKFGLNGNCTNYSLYNNSSKPITNDFVDSEDMVLESDRDNFLSNNQHSTANISINNNGKILKDQNDNQIEKNTVKIIDYKYLKLFVNQSPSNCSAINFLKFYLNIQEKEVLNSAYGKTNLEIAIDSLIQISHSSWNYNKEHFNSLKEMLIWQSVLVWWVDGNDFIPYNVIRRLNILIKDPITYGGIFFNQADNSEKQVLIKKLPYKDIFKIFFETFQAFFETKNSCFLTKAAKKYLILLNQHISKDLSTSKNINLSDVNQQNFSLVEKLCEKVTSDKINSSLKSKSFNRSSKINDLTMQLSSQKINKSCTNLNENNNLTTKYDENFTPKALMMENTNKASSLNIHSKQLEGKILTNNCEKELLHSSNIRVCNVQNDCNKNSLSDSEFLNQIAPLEVAGTEVVTNSKNIPDSESHHYIASIFSDESVKDLIPCSSCQLDPSIKKNSENNLFNSPSELCSKIELNVYNGSTNTSFDSIEKNLSQTKKSKTHQYKNCLDKILCLIDNNSESEDCSKTSNDDNLRSNYEAKLNNENLQKSKFTFKKNVQSETECANNLKSKYKPLELVGIGSIKTLETDRSTSDHVVEDSIDKNLVNNKRKRLNNKYVYYDEAPIKKSKNIMRKSNDSFEESGEKDIQSKRLFGHEKQKRKPWTEDEDIILLKNIEIYGCGNWAKIAKYLNGRTNVQIKDRWRILEKNKSLIIKIKNKI